MLADYFTNPLQGAFLYKFRDIIMGRVSLFTILEDTFPYKIKESSCKNIPSKDITFRNEHPLKETKKDA